jgi:hypothetical protein
MIMRSRGRYDHQDRLTAEEAMQHPYFNPIRGMLPLREVRVCTCARVRMLCVRARGCAYVGVCVQARAMSVRVLESAGGLLCGSGRPRDEIGLRAVLHSSHRN